MMKLKMRTIKICWAIFKDAIRHSLWSKVSGIIACLSIIESVSGLTFDKFFVGIGLTKYQHYYGGAYYRKFGSAHSAHTMELVLKKSSNTVCLKRNSIPRLN